jgi:AsmA protein
MTPKKKLFLAVALVAGLLALGLVGLRLAVNPEVFKPRIEALVHQFTGLTLHLEGPIRLRYFPWLGIELDKASLAGLAGFEQDTFLRVDKAVIEARLGKLLRGELETSAIRLQGLDLTLIRDQNGRGNWQSLPIRKVSLEKDTVVVHTDTGQTSFHFLLEGVSLVDGSLTFEDRLAGSTTRITALNASASRIAPGVTSDVSLSLKLESERPRLTASTSLRGKLSVVPDNLVFSFDQADLQLEATSPDLPFRRLRGTGKADVTVEGRDGQVTVRDFDLGATAAGGLFPEKGEAARLAGSLEYDATAGTLTVADLVLAGLGVTATGRLDAQLGRPDAAPRFVWKFATNAFSPKAVLASLGISLAGLPDGALNSLETKGEAVFSPSALGLTIESLRLDGQNLAFTAEVADFAKPAMRFSLTADALELDRYLPAGKPAAGQAVPPAKNAARGTTRPGANARVDGSIDVKRLTIKGLALTDLRATVQAADGTVAVRPFSLGLSGGSVSGGLAVALAKPIPDWSVDTTISGVAVKPVLASLTGHARLSGAFSSKANLTARGTTPQALLGSLTGTLSLRLDDGVVEGFSISQGLLTSIKGLVGLVELNPAALVAATGEFGQSLAASGHGETRLNRASASFQWNAGLGTTRDILVAAPQGKVTGSGTVHLGREQLNLSLLADVTGVGTVPLLVEGSLRSPKVDVDKEALAKQAVTNLPKALGKSVKEGGADLLKGVKGLFQ